MKNLIIIGAGGYGREMYNTAPLFRGYGEEFVVKGYIDDTEDPLGRFSGYPPVIGRIVDYQPQPGDVFTCAIADIEGRKKCTRLIEERGGEFITLISKLAGVGMNSTIGRGCVIHGTTRISCDCKIAEHVHFQGTCIVGHDAIVHPWCFFHVGCFLGGAVQVGEGAHLYTYSIIHPHKKVGAYATVGAGAFVIRNVPPGKTVYGNPAKIM